MSRRPPRSPLFPSTTLFRSRACSSARSCAVPTRMPVSSRSTPRGRRSEEHTSEIQSPLHLLFPLFFFLNEPAPTEISPLSLHDALPISGMLIGKVLRSPHAHARILAIDTSRA